ncbi:O-antigen ligase family protein [Armatimonas rosea]|uniref:O-antigen ligase domain-containing protein n=1 Tax=Armatimonas rosea TaxID=685828 RepID=A0A7W9SQQ9_ARMRO|nr:hypothetical protein [Armatimonas rosea]MBB6050468.1 hypothetical protein [Armatimonas rosea]
MLSLKQLLSHGLSKIGTFGSRIALTNFLLMSPVLMGSFSELARAGDSLSLPVHYALAILIFAIIWATLEFSVSIGTVIMLVYLADMGWIRRALIPSTGYISNDPITLISTFVSLLYFLRLVVLRKIPINTAISKTLLPLVIIMFLEVVNPLQGGIAVGLSGLIFRLGPLLWYYVGKMRGSRQMASLLFFVMVLVSVFEIIIGNRQWFGGFSEVEKFWIASGGGTQSAGKGYFRPFGTFLSFSEYVVVIVIGAGLCWVSFLQKKYIYIVPFIALFVTLFVSSSRGGMVSIFLVMVVMWAIQGKNYRAWLPRLAFAVVVALWGITFGLERVKEVEVDDKTQILVNHQIKGLSDPLGKDSTGGLHVGLITSGILQGFRVPTGIGLGAGTLGASKFGAGGGSSETDVSDMFASLGFIGGILYVVLCIRIFIGISKYWHDSRDVLALSTLALMTACNGRWSSGGHYAQSMFFWLIIGTMDKIIFEYYFMNKKSNPDNERRSEILKAGASS